TVSPPSALSLSTAATPTPSSTAAPIRTRAGTSHPWRRYSAAGCSRRPSGTFPPSPHPPHPMRPFGRLLLLAGLLLAAPPAAATPVADSLTHYYATRDAGAILRLYRQAQTREERLLCSYRLFPLTQDAAWLSDIPDEARTARELALVAAHWGYRTAGAAPWQLPLYGRRSEGALARARALDPDEPYVLLVEGQSLLYKP